MRLACLAPDITEAILEGKIIWVYS
jgi:hypothetical protein